MFNFKQLVESLLLEIYNPADLDQILGQTKGSNPNNEWIYDIVELHNTKYNNTPIEQQKLKNCFDRALQTYNSQPKPNLIKDCLPLERLYDAFFTVAKQAKSAGGTFSQPSDFATNDKVKAAGERFLTAINSLPDWDLQNPDVRSAYNSLMAENELTARAALSTYNNKSVLEAVNEMIKKRTDVLSRIMAIRNPFGPPFQGLVKDTLLNPEQYAAGNKKVTKDFKNIVDDLYFRNVLQVGLTAKEFYESLFPQQPLNKVDYEKMLNNTLVNQSTGNQEDFTIKGIQARGTEESIALIRALKNIAEYTRDKASRGETVGKVAGAIGALRVGMGPVG